MKKEVILIEHNIAQTEKKEKIIVGVLLAILPFVGAIKTYGHYSATFSYWLILGMLGLMIVYGVRTWHRLFLRFAIFSQFVLASSLIASYTLESMMKGMSLIPTTTQSLQYGLINFGDLTISFLILCYVTFVTTHVMFRRRAFEQQERAYRDMKL